MSKLIRLVIEYGIHNDTLCHLLVYHSTNVAAAAEVVDAS